MIITFYKNLKILFLSIRNFKIEYLDTDGLFLQI